MDKVELMLMSSMESPKAPSKRRKGKGLMTRNRLCRKSWVPIIMFSMLATKRANKTWTKISMELHLLIIYLLEPMPDMVQSKIISPVMFKTILMLSLVMLRPKTIKKECSQVKTLTTSMSILMLT